MAERQTGFGPVWARTQRPTATASWWQSLLWRLQDNAPNSTQLISFIISGSILLFLSGLTLIGTVMAIVFLGPIVLLTSPIWVPAAFLIFVTAVAIVSACGFGVAVVAGSSWLYRYFMGRHPVGADRVDYARSRIADTASHVKDYAREYGGYLTNRVKDAAPGA
ncbi:oleosin 1-like [Canna indica]|uniref:Oleosin 1-like n=1 Tax=Canna indica TaxID=4628 RepID=A0AAQ3Q686_9LILI|nr:oleosin 1-like [Canna indica]